MIPAFSKMPEAVRTSAVRLLACDPGVTGGLAVFVPNECPQLIDMPEDPADLLSIAFVASPDIVVIEKVHSGPKMGAANAFKFGEQYASMRMMAANAVPKDRIVLAPPASWQAYFKLVRPDMQKPTHSQKKSMNRKRAGELFPGIRLTNRTADALLIGLWALDRYIPKYYPDLLQPRAKQSA